MYQDPAGHIHSTFENADIHRESEIERGSERVVDGCVYMHIWSESMYMHIFIFIILE